MIAGTTAEQLLLFAGGRNHLASIDFVNDIYTVNGATAVLSDIIDQPLRRSASGLSCKKTSLWSGANAAIHATGPLLNLLLEKYDFTMVFEYETTTDWTDPANGAVWMAQFTKITQPSGTYLNGGWDGDLQAYLQPGGGGAFVFEEMLITPFTQRSVTMSLGEFPNGQAPHIGKMAFTRAPVRLAVAQEGQFDGPPDAADTMTVIVQTFDDVIFGDTNWGSGVTIPAYIRKIDIFAPHEDEGLLPGLTS